ncbi:MAG TPA: endonuclease/exonuclease/phosphatase family protein, partial [Mycobacteriales bacterium]|nr:endonuclease/exonuclease/phosphatase family protein [Mycobacteriales bacterium]
VVGTLARELGAGGRPVVVGGDLNTQPADPAFRALLDAGLTDALAGARPLPTSPADAPAKEIDHVLVTPGVVAADAVAPRSTASDHLAVAVTLRLPGPTS